KAREFIHVKLVRFYMLSSTVSILVGEPPKVRTIRRSVHYHQMTCRSFYPSRVLFADRFCNILPIKPSILGNLSFNGYQCTLKSPHEITSEYSCCRVQSIHGVTMLVYFLEK